MVRGGARRRDDPWVDTAAPGGVSKTRAGVVFGLAAMAGSDVPAALGVTNPAKWDANSWLSDILPHFAYGLMMAVVYDYFTGVK